MKLKEIKTASEARQMAIDWQTWSSKRALSFAQLFQWQQYFKKLAKTFKLTKEFKENGII